MEIDIVGMSPDRRLRMWSIEQAIILLSHNTDRVYARDIVREAEHLEEHVREADYDDMD